MAKKITSSDIAEIDIFKYIRDSAEKTITSIEKINNEFRETATVLKKGITGAKFDNSKSIDEFGKSVTKVNAIQKDSIKIEQELSRLKALKAKADAEIEKSTQQKLKTSQQQATADAKATKEIERQTKAITNEANAYKQLELKTRELKNESKKLGAELLHLEQSGKRNTKEYRELASTYKKVTQSAQQGDVQLKKLDKTVGDNFRKVGDYSGAVNKLRNGLGQLGLAFGIGTVVTSAGKTIVEFDQKIADLVSITGAGGKDLEFYKQQAIEMGKGVQGGASAVIEAYKLIGSAKPELLKNAKALDAVTKSAITLSQASGMTLPESATALTDAMNQFGAPAEKAGQFIDALANGALLGSAEIPQVTEALLKFGAIAKNANVPIEESVGLIETLAEKGLKGAEAGTALRNVMLKISAPDALPKEAQERLKALGVSFDDLKDKSKPFSERLKLLKPLLKDNASMVKVFGLENTVSATTLIQNTERIAELTAGMDKQGTASKQAQDRTKTLSFAFNELKESWNAVVLSLSSGEGTSKILVEGLSFIARNLGTILEYVGKAVVAWGAYRTILLAVQAKNFIFNGGLKDTISSMKDVVSGTKKMGEGAKQAGGEVSKAGKAMTAVPWMVVIGLALELGTALWDIASGASEAEAKMKAFNIILAGAEKTANTKVAEIDKQFEAEMKLLDLRKASGKFTKQQMIDEEKAIIQTARTRLKQAKIEVYLNAQKLQSQRDLIKADYDEAVSTNVFFRSISQSALIAKYTLLSGAIRGQQKESIIYTEKLKELENGLHNVTVQEIELGNETEIETAKTVKSGKAIEVKTKKMKDANDQLERMNTLMQETQDLTDEIALFEAGANVDSAIQSQMDSISQSGQYSVDLIKQLINEEYKLQKAIIERQFLESMDIATTEQEVINAKAKRDYELGKLEEQTANKTKTTLKDLETAQEDYAEKTNKTEEVVKKSFENQREFIKLTADYFIKRSNDKIAQYDKEIAMAEKQSDILQQLAINGNITAKESLAEQQKLIVEANRKKEAEARKQQRIKLAESVYSAYTSNVEKDEKNPLAKTITDITLLSQFIQSIPTFYEGTETTVGDALGKPQLSGRDGHIVRVDGSEKILNPTLSRMTGDLTTNQIAKIAMEYNNGKLVQKGEGAVQIQTGWNSIEVLKKLDEIGRVIADKPESNIEVGRIVQGAMDIVHSQKIGNSIIYNKFRVK